MNFARLAEAMAPPGIRFENPAETPGESARALRAARPVVRECVTDSWAPARHGGGRPSRLERGDVHISIMAASDDTIHGRLLCPLYLLAVMPDTHRLCRRRTLDITELVDERLLLLGRGFASREWFYATCQVAQIRPRVILESSAPQTLVALAGRGYGVAVVPSMVLIPPGSVRAVPVLFRRVPIGRWMIVTWNAQRFLAPYAKQFVEEIVASTRCDYPGRQFTRRAPPLPRLTLQA